MTKVVTGMRCIVAGIFLWVGGLIILLLLLALIAGTFIVSLPKKSFRRESYVKVVEITMKALNGLYVTSLRIAQRFSFF